MYKTMVLALLQQNPELHDHLRRNRTLLPTLDLYARQLRTSHQIWKDRLAQTRPDTGECQRASEALEIALQELKDCLTSGLLPNGIEPPSRDGAMAFLRARTPPA